MLFFYSVEVLHFLFSEFFFFLYNILLQAAVCFLHYLKNYESKYNNTNTLLILIKFQGKKHLSLNVPDLDIVVTFFGLSGFFFQNEIIVYKTSFLFHYWRLQSIFPPDGGCNASDLFFKPSK